MQDEQNEMIPYMQKKLEKLQWTENYHITELKAARLEMEFVKGYLERLNNES